MNSLIEVGESNAFLRISDIYSILPTSSIHLLYEFIHVYTEQNLSAHHLSKEALNIKVGILSFLYCLEGEKGPRIKMSMFLSLGSHRLAPNRVVQQGVDVIITSECIHLYILCIIPQCLFWDVSIMYLSHVMPRCSYQEVL